MIKIMIVDDDAVITTQLEKLLTTMRYEVVGSASTGQEALELARKSRPDIVLMDIVMPGKIDGIEASKKLKAEMDIPVIFLTGSADDEYLKKAEVVEPFGYIIKPYQKKEIRACIEIALHKKKVERKLWESEKRFKDLSYSMADWIWEVDKDGRYTFASGKLRKILGYNPAELMGKTPFELMPEDEAQRVGKIFKAIASEKKPIVDLENWNLTRQGEKICLLTNGVPILDDKGKLAGYRGVDKDITGRKKAEKEMLKLSRDQQIILDSVPALIWYKDTENRILRANKVAAESAGLTLAEIEGNSCYDLFPAEADRYYQDDQEVIQSGLPKLGIVEELQTVSAGKRWVCTDKIPCRDDQNNITGVIVFAVDITERKRMEEELLKLQKLESVGLLAGGIAHDFNNILMSILGNVSFLKTDLDPDNEIFKALFEVEAACRQGKNLTYQLLTFSTGGSPVKKTVPISDILKEAVGLALHGSNVRCEFIFADNLMPVWVDPGQINQAFTNIVINADQAMPQGGVITVSAENIEVDGKAGLPLPQGSYVRITFKDTGIGIKEENLPKIFDPYFTTKARGRGLGLAGSYSIVKNHGGLLTVESKLGKGTTFVVYLSASENMIDEKREPEEKITIGTGRVLLMDDEECVREVVVKLLSRLGYEVESAEDGAKAIEVFQKAREEGFPFDVVILDLTVPGGMGGKEAVRRLKEIDPGLRAIVSSGYSNDPIMAEYKKFGFDAVIAKPYKIMLLGKVLNRVMEKK
ncbi:MAG: response regulator [Candidatus Euphemobacter frigidus]|nr:response regulator [Candidatus Euphemobacter frigidus]